MQTIRALVSLAFFVAHIIQCNNIHVHLISRQQRVNPTYLSPFWGTIRHSRITYVLYVLGIRLANRKSVRAYVLSSGGLIKPIRMESEIRNDSTFGCELRQSMRMRPELDTKNEMCYSLDCLGLQSR